MISVGERLYRKYRIKKRSDVKSFFGKKNNTLFLSSKKNAYSIIVKKNNYDYFRFAASVKKSKGCAPIRNREKRIVREIFRRNKDCIPKGYDYFIIVNDVHKNSFDSKSKNLLFALSRCRL